MKKGILIGIAVLFCSFCYVAADTVSDILNGINQGLQQGINDMDATRNGRCSYCNGTGTCSYCGGSGYINDLYCWSCKGSGSCRTCGGDGNFLN